MAPNKKKQVEEWVRAVFRLPSKANVEVEEIANSSGMINIALTRITITAKGKSTHHDLPIALKEVERSSIEGMKDSMQAALYKKFPVSGRLYRFFGWWMIFSGGIALTAVCPVCGQAGCPVGIGSIAFLGGIFALLTQNGKAFLSFLHRKIFFLRKSPGNP